MKTLSIIQLLKLFAIVKKKTFTITNIKRHRQLTLCYCIEIVVNILHLGSSQAIINWFTNQQMHYQKLQFNYVTGLYVINCY